MKHWNPFSSDKKSGKSAGSRIAFQGGAYSLAAAAILLAILIAANVLVSALPASMTRYDISATKLYSITSNTKVVVNALEEDVTIYWIVQSGAEDDVIETLLSKYDSLSDHITVVKKNPDVYPTFAEQYTDEAVQNNSLVVECGDRSRYIGYDDIYVQEADMYSYSYSTSFDGEGAITSAIDYVVTDELPQLYLLEGHGEQELPATFSEQIEKENIETICDPIPPGAAPKGRLLFSFPASAACYPCNFSAGLPRLIYKENFPVSHPGKGGRAPMKKAQKTPWLFLRFGAAGCAAALALYLPGCGQAGASSQSLPAFSASQSEEGPQAQSAPSGTQMSEEEIFQLAADLIAQGQTLDDRVAALSLWELDKDDSFTEDLYGHQEIVFYRLLSVQDKAQLRQMLMEVFSEEYTDEMLQELFAPDAVCALRERDGKLYVSENWLSRQTASRQYTGKLILIGRTEDVISLQAQLSYQSGMTQLFENHPLTLRREKSGWKVDGWKNEMAADNSFVELPPELEQMAANDPELATSLQYAWTLGGALARGEQRWVDWCFSGLFEAPTSYQELGYPLQDITGLVVSGCAVEAGPDGAVYLRLDVDDPGTTPLRTGSNWYLLTFGRDIDRVDGVIQHMYPDSEQAAFGLGRAAEIEEAALNRELTAVTDLFHDWACAEEAGSDWWETSNDILPAEIPYVAVRMSQDGRTDPDGRFTAEEFQQAAREYLDEPKYKADRDRLLQRCTEQDGRFALMPMGGLMSDIGLVCRDLGSGLAGGTATVVRRYYKDELGLVPDYDLVYTLHRSLGGKGSWCVSKCAKQPFGPESIQ